MTINPLPRQPQPVANRPPLRAPEFRPVDIAACLKRLRRLTRAGKRLGWPAARHCGTKFHIHAAKANFQTFFAVFLKKFCQFKKSL